jgi:hypothetical protein
MIVAGWSGVKRARGYFRHIFWHIEEFRDHGWHLHGTDFSPTGIEFAKKNYPEIRSSTVAPLGTSAMRRSMAGFR